MRRWRWNTVAAAALVGWSVAGLAVSVAAGLTADLGLWMGITGTGLVSALLVARRPENRVGWLLAVASTIGVLGTILNSSLPEDPSPDAAGIVVLLGVVAFMGWIAYLLLMIAFVPLVFPTGKALSPAWSWVLRLGAVYAAAILVANLLQREFCLDVDPAGGCVAFVANPIGIAAIPNLEFGLEVLWESLLVFMSVAVASLVVRYLRSEGIARRQLTWFTLAFVAWIAITYTEEVFLRNGVYLDDITAWAWAGDFVWVLIPVAAAVGILKYRLFDIDRIVSRTVAWTLTSGVLVGIYAGAVVTLSGLARSLTGDRNSSVAVAASTLLAAAAFGPVRRRVQAAVDHRFNRARYDALRTVEKFGAAVRTSPDPAIAADQLLSTVAESLHPTRMQLVLREEPA